MDESGAGAGSSEGSALAGKTEEMIIEMAESEANCDVPFMERK